MKRNRGEKKRQTERGQGEVEEDRENDSRT